MGSFFNPEKGIWAWLSTAVDIVGLSIAWLFLCLPLVTAGPATAALYHAVVLYVRPREQGAFKDFFRSFRRNLRVGAAATLVCLAAGAALAAGTGAGAGVLSPMALQMALIAMQRRMMQIRPIKTTPTPIRMTNGIDGSIRCFLLLYKMRGTGWRTALVP